MRPLSRRNRTTSTDCPAGSFGFYPRNSHASTPEALPRRGTGPPGGSRPSRTVINIAPVLIGGGGKPALAGPGALNIADARRFQLEDVVRMGPDVRLTATPLR
jgi:diaminohydroxyphosphoribosylaminopyrimidine deaminase/5-amino-6-(5-phosphoribosylamino)uracil reductase